MSDTPAQVALREWRRGMTRPLTWGLLAGLTAVLALAGPFGTDDLLPLAPRALYWAVIALCSYGGGALLGCLMAPVLRARPMALRVVVQGSVTTLVVWAVVLSANLVGFGWWPDPAELPVFLGTLWVITLIVTAILEALEAHKPAAAMSPRPPALPPILARLPVEKRAALVALSVEDHYVRVRTLKGEALILMRLSDAIREVGETPGAQVHRSHWAAFGQVTAARREGDRGILTMAVGDEVPVSRANLAKIREAGLLPR